LIPPVFSQIGYPGAGDVDDCWVVATVWAEQASRPGSFKPTVPQFRAKADKPDAPGPTGGNIQNVYAGARGCWPDLAVRLYISDEIEPLLKAVRAGQPASIALDSGDLPARLRFGFTGKHQCGLASPDGSRLVLANPLARNGTPALAITGPEVARAMLGLLTPAQSRLRFRAVLFPKPLGFWEASIHPKPTDPDGKQPFLVYRVHDHDERPLRIVSHNGHVPGTGGNTFTVRPPVKAVRGPGYDGYVPPKGLVRAIEAIPNEAPGGYLDAKYAKEA
jgi:hypothetical protein